MNKQEVLKDYKKQEDKLCLSQVLDKIEFCESREKLEYTDFLDMYQVALVENFLRRINFKNYQFFGGYEDSERKILIVYPDKYNDSMIEKNYSKMLKILRIELPEEEFGKYSHRNYLGGIVKLGLKLVEQTRNLGLRSILQASGYNRIDSTSVSFGIAPRINASGRMGHQEDALQLFLSKDT